MPVTEQRLGRRGADTCMQQLAQQRESPASRPGACPPGFQGSVTVVVSVCPGAASESLLFPAAGEGKGLPSMNGWERSHSVYRLRPTGAFPTACPGNPDGSNVGRAGAQGQP